MDLIFGHKKVEKYMSPEVRTLDELETVFSAIQTMAHYNISCLVVTSNKKAVGVITERDIMRRVSLEGRDLKKCTIKEVMSSPIIYKPSNTKINEIIALMSRYGIRRLIIMDDEKLKGIITQTDIVRMSNKYIEIIDVVKLYFYMLLVIGLISSLYLLIKLFM